tara:strand:+ start:1832 stop:2071 length:240 start_codon:yes stop_codon:yes gene_type:complete
LKNFWPHRSRARGFAISNNDLQYRDKISKMSSSKISNQFLNDRNLKSIEDESNQKVIEQLSIKRGHWANRDFSEYRQVA